MTSFIDVYVGVAEVGLLVAMTATFTTVVEDVVLDISYLTLDYGAHRSKQFATS